MCPVSVRAEDEQGRPDNRISGMFVHLRTEIDDVAERLAAIALATRGAKEDHKAVDAKFLQNWAEHAAPSTFALATRLYSRLNLADRHPPIYNLVVSNVPGPDFPLYLDGAELVATYPMGPIIGGRGAQRDRAVLHGQRGLRLPGLRRAGARRVGPGRPTSSRPWPSCWPRPTRSPPAP